MKMIKSGRRPSRRRRRSRLRREVADTDMVIGIEVEADISLVAEMDIGLEAGTMGETAGTIGLIGM